jgi:hypothetical protein
MPAPHLRASDADRAAVADMLGSHMSAGRLTVAEYDERLMRAYAARTYGELEELTADLPTTAVSQAGTATSSAVTAAGRSSSGAHRTSEPSPRGTSGPARGPAWGHLWGGGVCGSWSAGTGRAVWGQWLTTAIIVTTIWLVSSLGSGEWIYPWPIWVIGPWGAVLLAQAMTGPGRGHAQERDTARLDSGSTSGAESRAASLAAPPPQPPERAPS